MNREAIISVCPLATKNTAKAFGLSTTAVQILYTCYHYDVVHKDNTTKNIAYRMGKAQENYLFAYVRKLELSGYLFGQKNEQQTHKNGRKEKFYKCTRQGIDVVKELFIQIDSHAA